MSVSLHCYNCTTNEMLLCSSQCRLAALFCTYSLRATYKNLNSVCHSSSMFWTFHYIEHYWWSAQEAGSTTSRCRKLLHLTLQQWSGPFKFIEHFCIYDADTTTTRRRCSIVYSCRRAKSSALSNACHVMDFHMYCYSWNGIWTIDILS